VIEPDLGIAGLAQALRDGAGLLVAREAVRQPLFPDLLLMLLEGRHMRVAEHREAVRAQFDRARDRVEARGHRLVRQAVDQVEINARNSGTPQAGACGFRLRKTLHAVDGALHLRIKALHAETGAVDAAERQRLDHA
jgi:hypothetical protein